MTGGFGIFWLWVERFREIANWGKSFAIFRNFFVSYATFYMKRYVFLRLLFDIEIIVLYETFYVQRRVDIEWQCFLAIFKIKIGALNAMLYIYGILFLELNISVAKVTCHFMSQKKYEFGTL